MHHLPRRPSLAAALPVLAAALLATPAVHADEPPRPAASVGALTLESSPSARLFRAFAATADADATASSWDFSVSVVAPTAPASTPRAAAPEDLWPAGDGGKANEAAWPSTLATATAGGPVPPAGAARRTRTDDLFAADMLAAPARTLLSDDLAARWLVGPQPSAAYTPIGGAEAWGANNFGQLGNNSTTTSKSPVAVSGLSGNVTAVAAGYGHTLAVQNGAVYAWGYNSNGQLGNNSTTNSSTPVAVQGLTSGVTAVAAGDMHSLAIKAGAAYAWGANGYGELGNNSMIDSSTPVAVSGLTSGVTAIAAGGQHSLAVQNGAALAWGDNTYGQLGNPSYAQSSVPVAVQGLTSGVTAIAAGEAHGLAIQNGAVYAWGYNSYGQLGNNSTTQANTPVAVLGLSTGVTAIAAGQAHSLAVQNGNVFAWGYNSNGQLGNGTKTNSSTPVEVQYSGAPLANILAVAANAYSSYALASDGSLYVWGYNGQGQLGLGSTTSYTTPQHLTAPAGDYYQLIGGGADGDFVVAILGTTPLPEPSTWAAGVLTLAAAGFALRRRLARPAPCA